MSISCCWLGFPGSRQDAGSRLGWAPFSISRAQTYQVNAVSILLELPGRRHCPPSGVSTKILLYIVSMGQEAGERLPENKTNGERNKTKDRKESDCVYHELLVTAVPEAIP